MIRLAHQGEATTIAEASRDIIERGLPWRWRAARIVAHIRWHESCVIVDSNDGVLRGFACASFGEPRRAARSCPISNEEMHLNLLGVLPHWQRHGIGARMLGWLERSALTAGIGVVRLEVRETSAARSFYAARGYRQVRLRRGYYLGREHAIEMARDLWLDEVRFGEAGLRP